MSGRRRKWCAGLALANVQLSEPMFAVKAGEMRLRPDVRRKVIQLHRRERRQRRAA